MENNKTADTVKDYLKDYLIDWELVNVLLCGKSALDSRYFLGTEYNEVEVDKFIAGYGLDTSNPISKAELFGNYQEALQFIRRYFLKEGSEDGLDFKIPSFLLNLTDVEQLFHMATLNNGVEEREKRIWCEIVLKIMHTILHADRDLRSNYFHIVQTQIFDRFYKHLFRDAQNQLYLGPIGEKTSVPLVEFQTKAKKTRDSIIIKLLHKVENVAEELFDRVGLRIVTQSHFDTLRVLRYLVKNSVIIPHNIIPRRSVNTLFEIEKFRKESVKLLKKAMKDQMDETSFLKGLEELSRESLPGDSLSERNAHSSKKYRSLQITCRYLIKYRNPFIDEFNQLRELVREREREGQQDILGEKILNLDTSLLARDIRFFYPSEIQIVDQAHHHLNTEGEASHSEYKKAQVKSAMLRVFKPLIEFHQSLAP
jgi:uncharacterized protein (TIGR04562 family)